MYQLPSTEKEDEEEEEETKNNNPKVIEKMDLSPNQYLMAVRPKACVNVTVVGVAYSSSRNSVAAASSHDVMGLLISLYWYKYIY